MSRSVSGQKFGSVTVTDIHSYTTAPNGTRCYKYNAICDCGNKFVTTHKAIRGVRKTNGFLCRLCFKKSQADASASGYKHKLHAVWQAMINRCYDPTCHSYKRYGGRGIYVCDTWLQPTDRGSTYSIKGFHQFLKDMGDRPEGTSIDRIDNDGPYAPWNCRWATQVEQANNTSANVLVTVEGRTQTVTQWARELGTGVGRIDYAFRAHGVPREVVIKRLMADSPKGRKNIQWVNPVRAGQSRTWKGPTTDDHAREVEDVLVYDKQTRKYK